MKLPSIDSLSKLEITLFMIFIIYIIFPIQTPISISPYINHSFGIGMVIIITLYLLFYSTPVLGVLSLFVSYELLRRSSNNIIIKNNSNLPSSIKSSRKTSSPAKTAEVVQNTVKNNDSKFSSLEEEIINKNNPVGMSISNNSYIESSFKPLFEKIQGASMA